MTRPYSTIDKDLLDLKLQPFTPATQPIEMVAGRRDAVRMLVMERASSQFHDARFTDLPEFLRAGDVLVVNTSQTIKARLHARCSTERLCLHLAAYLRPNLVIVERRSAVGEPDDAPFKLGDCIDIIEPESGRVTATVRVNQKFHPNSRLWVVESSEDLYALAPAIGQPIQYAYVTSKQRVDAYQTIFAHHPGSSEMPSASRPFTRPLLKQIAARGVRVCSLTLHTTVSSHEVTASLADHPVVPEWYHIPAWTAAAINRAKQQNGRVIAVGTTVVRALEASAEHTGMVKAQSAWTQYLVTPEQPVRVVDGLVTGMHDNHSSHLALMYAFVKRETLKQAYAHAAVQGYRWHEFGDVSLVL